MASPTLRYFKSNIATGWLNKRMHVLDCYVEIVTKENVSQQPFIKKIIYMNVYVCVYMYMCVRACVYVQYICMYSRTHSHTHTVYSFIYIKYKSMTCLV